MSIGCRADLALFINTVVGRTAGNGLGVRLTGPVDASLSVPLCFYLKRVLKSAIMYTAKRAAGTETAGSTCRLCNVLYIDVVTLAGSGITGLVFCVTTCTVRGCCFARSRGIRVRRIECTHGRGLRELDTQRKEGAGTESMLLIGVVQ